MCIDDKIEKIRQERDRQLRHASEQGAHDNPYALRNRQKANLLTWVLDVLADDRSQKTIHPLSTFYSRVKWIIEADRPDEYKVKKIAQDLSELFPHES